jgi:hypothetical protein
MRDFILTIVPIAGIAILAWVNAVVSEGIAKIGAARNDRYAR